MSAGSNGNREIVLTARPQDGRVTAGLFQLRDAPRPEPGPGELLLRNHYLSLDPAMRGWISETPNYRNPVPLGEVMPGFTVAEVVAFLASPAAAYVTGVAIPVGGGMPAGL